ncbi:MAG: DUF3552 domain-containing protein [Deltaproteobacteria bacterium]|nr:DUF3552 domain-containing protein [Deltaproteobacteria bacterium]
MVEILVIIVVCGAALGVGLVMGASRRRQQIAMTIAAASQQADRIREEAARSVGLMKREGQAQGDEIALEVARVAGEEHRDVAEQTERLRGRITRLQQRLAESGSVLDERQTALDGRFAEIRRQRDATRDVRNEMKAVYGSFRGLLEESAGTTAQDVHDAIVDRLLEQTRSRSADQLRNLETSGAIDFDREAKRVMGIAMGRYTGHSPRERGGAVMALAAGEARKLQDDFTEVLALLEGETEVNLVFGEGDSLRLETGDGVAREVCRRVLKRCLDGKNVTNPKEVMASVEADVQGEVMQLGRKALRRLRLKKADDEIVNLLGRLNWRTSYTQNQYRHAMEAGQLAGLIASELRIDLHTARRVGLLHDIGKAISHHVDGSHAINGAEIARRVGEDELICNAIGAHHGEEPMNSAHAYLAAATDAMSGGRPGARREITESYGDRIGDLERIASSFRGVATVHAVQAGRELRVLVDDHRVNDNALEELSARIATKISDEMTFPGQIRVTVIREFRTVSIAN